ncbi:hypothetical protein [Streptomyces sp. enrichment culture]|uniref:hypothetical protein n=1 Tax=Streptomyces sp. enrichment culture TaxID=1795815 RepID=UPI003F54B937
MIAIDGLPLVRPYVAVGERERDGHERWCFQGERRRVAVRAEPGRGRFSGEAAV